MKDSSLPRWFLIVLVLGWLLALPGPAAVSAAPLAAPPAFSASLVSAPPPVLCPGDQAALTVFILETTRGLPAAGYPVNILQSDPAVGQLDPVSKVVTNGTVHFTYKSNDNGAGKGTRTDVLTFNTGGFPTGLKVPITVSDCGDYRFDFLLEKRKTEDPFELYTYISGKSTAARLDQQLTGVETGVAKAFVSLGGAANGMVCQLEPSIRGSGVFSTDGLVRPQAPGFDLVTVHFTFDQMAFNSAMLTCAVMDVKAAYPFDVGKWDPDELGLQGLVVPVHHNRGTVPISAKGLAGQLTVRREAK